MINTFSKQEQSLPCWGIENSAHDRADRSGLYKLVRARQDWSRKQPQGVSDSWAMGPGCEVKLP